MDGLVAPALVGCALLLYHSCKPEKYQPAELLANDTNFLLNVSFYFINFGAKRVQQRS